MKIKYCRICKSDKLKDYLNLGKMHPADSFLDSRSDDINLYPLGMYL